MVSLGDFFCIAFGELVIRNFNTVHLVNLIILDFGAIDDLTFDGNF